MHPQQPTTPEQSGFSVIEVLLAVLVVAALAVTGLVVYQHHKPNSAKNSAATGTSQTTTQPSNTTTTQPAPTTTQYLTIKEWGVKLPLSSAINDAYYSVGGNVGTDGLPNTMWLGLTSLNSSGCNASNEDSPSFKPIGAIVRVLPTNHDPGTGKLYTQQDPNGTTINGYYYGYTSNISKDSSCSSATTLQSIDSAFGTAAKGIVTATTPYLTITEWGVRLALTSSTSSLYYYINPQQPDVAFLSLKTVSDIAPDCAAVKASLAAIGRQTPAVRQDALNKHLQAGTVQIGNYWYAFSHEPVDCTDGTATMRAAVSNAEQGVNFDDLFKTLQAVPTTN